MTAQIIEGTSITRPEPDALISTVLDHATVVENSKFGLRNNEGLWPSYNCLDLLVPTPDCANPVGMADFQKDFKVAGWVPGFQFAVHGGVQCSAVGIDAPDQKAEVERVFSRSEGKGVEMALLLNRFADNPVDPAAPVSPYTATWEAPTDITVAGMSLAGAIAALESYAAALYAGRPTLHMPRGAVLLAFGQGLITETGGKFYTKTGAKVAAGGGYDDPDTPPDGTYDIFATGEVYVERAKTLSFQEYVIPGDGSGTGSDQNGLGDNTVIALVERQFRVGIDCFAAKATGRAWGA